MIKELKNFFCELYLEISGKEKSDKKTQEYQPINN